MRRETLEEKAWAGDRETTASSLCPVGPQRVASIREAMLISHRRRGCRAPFLFPEREKQPALVSSDKKRWGRHKPLPGC